MDDPLVCITIKRAVHSVIPTIDAVLYNACLSSLIPCMLTFCQLKQHCFRLGEREMGGFDNFYTKRCL